MISFKFAIGGQDVFVQSDNVAEAMQIIFAMAPKAKAAKVTKVVRTNKTTQATKRSYPYVKDPKNAPRAWQRWTLEEVRVLNENKNLRTDDLVKIPSLAGRNRATLINMRSALRNPATALKDAPTNFRKFAEVVMADA